MLELPREALEKMRMGESIWPEESRRGWDLEEEIVRPLFDAILQLQNVGSNVGSEDRPFSNGLFPSLFIYDQREYPQIRESREGDPLEITEYYKGRALLLSVLAPYAVYGPSSHAKYKTTCVTDGRLVRAGESFGFTNPDGLIHRAEDEQDSFFHPVLKLIGESPYCLLSSEEFVKPLPAGVIIDIGYGIDGDTKDDYNHLLFPCDD